MFVAPSCHVQRELELAFAHRGSTSVAHYAGARVQAERAVMAQERAGTSM